MSAYDTTSSGFTLTEVDALWYKAVESFWASTAATTCAEVTALTGTGAWCTTDGPSYFAFLGTLYKAVVMVAPPAGNATETSFDFFRWLLFGAECDPNTHFTPGRDFSSADITATYWSSTTDTTGT